MAINKVLLIGNVGAVPATREVNGNKMATFSLATTDNYKAKDGERKSQTEWHSVVCYGKLAEFVAEYITKGSQVFVDGKIHYSKSDDKYFTNIVANSVQFVGSKPKNNNDYDDDDFPA